MACHNKYMAKRSIKTEASERLQETVTKNIRVRLALYDVKQTTLAEALLQTQAGLSAKINRKSEWTVADIANAAAFFHEPVENLITSSTLDAISSGSEYQLNQNGSVDISRRELSAPAGARYLRKPDDDERRSHGAVGPRAFVMPLDVDQMNLGPRFSARTRFKLPRMCQRPKAIMDALADHLGDIGLEDGWDDPHVAADGSIQCGCLAEFPDITAWRAHLAQPILEALSRISS